MPKLLLLVAMVMLKLKPVMMLKLVSYFFMSGMNHLMSFEVNRVKTVEAI